MADELKWLGLAEQKAKETLKNAVLTEQLKQIALSARSHASSVSKQQGAFLYQLGAKTKPQFARWTPLIVKLVMEGDIRNDPQLAAAIEFLLTHAASGVDEHELRVACGAGVVISQEQIEDTVADVFRKYDAQLRAERYAFNIGRILSDVKQSLQWADGAAIKREVDLMLVAVLGPKTEEELCPVHTPRKKPATPAVTKTPKNAAAKEIGKGGEGENGTGGMPETNGAALDGSRLDAEGGAATMEELMRKRAHFHAVGENYKTDGYVITPNTSALLAKHVRDVGGKVMTRFPPEPNGILHIGHAKAININFGYAKAHGGYCYLRFDDTNPEKEEEKFFTAIADMVNWLGYTPYRVTHSSDYFDQLYAWALELIEKDLAYVCHQGVEEMRGIDAKPSPWRDRPIAESRQLFQDMKRGKFEEGAATLRLKTTLEEGKMDPVAYRIKFVAHHRTGNKWCIYPTYDYTHCLCDSLENITHSLCTKEFQSRRSSYYWLCNALDIYCPVQWEYGRLNVAYTVVSKRKILKLITSKTVSDWDDPRLFTLTALRRRGIPPEAINNMVANLGLTGAQMTIDPHVIDAAARDFLNGTAPRTMAVLEPLRVTIANYDELHLPTTVSVPDFPAEVKTSVSNSEKHHNVAFAKTIFIERGDYRQNNDDKGFRRLTAGQAVGLKHVGLVIVVEKEIKDANDVVVELVVRADAVTATNKAKAFIHWVAEPVTCAVRLYDRLFRHKNPEDTTQVPDGFLSDCNKLVFNRTVLLKEDVGKK